MDKEDLTVGVVVSGDPDAGDSSLRPKKSEEGKNRMKTLNFERVDLVLLRKCACGTLLENALEAKEARRGAYFQGEPLRIETCTSVSKKMSRCHRRLMWLNDKLSSKRKRKCMEGRSRGELARRAVEIPPELISLCEIRKARAQLDLEVLRGLYRANFSRPQ